MLDLLTWGNLLRLVGVSALLFLLAWLVVRREWSLLRSGERQESVGRGGLQLKRDRLRFNFPEMRDIDQKALLGPKLPRREVMAAMPPVDGLTVVEGIQGSGKSMLTCRVMTIWQQAGALGVSNRWIAPLPGDPDPIHWAQVVEGLGGPYYSPDDAYAVLAGYAAERRLVVLGGLQSTGKDARPWWDLMAVLAVQEAHADWATRMWICGFLDEVSVDADNRDWARFPLELAHDLNQLRKYQFAGYLTGVVADKLDSKLLDVTGWRWKCKMRTGLFLPGTIVAVPTPTEEQSSDAERRRRSITLRLRRGDVERLDSGAIYARRSLERTGPKRRVTYR